MAIVLTNPALWVGATALLAPLAIHLLTRSSTRTISFPSLVFLHAAKASRSRVHRLRHWIMLLLRALALACLLLAFLKPVGLSGGISPRATAHDPSAAVVLLDVSASLDYREDGLSGFSRARAAAERVLRELPAGHRANLILAGLAPRPSLAEPAANRGALLRDLAVAQVSLERCDAQAALAEAVRELRGLEGFRKELVLISDFQRANWAAVDFGTVPADVQLLFLPVRERPLVNLALTEIALQPVAPSAGEPVDVTCTVRNDGRAAAPVPLSLRVGEDFEALRPVTVPPGESVGVTFRLTAGKPGLLAGEVRIPGDDFDADNARYFATAVGGRPQVLVISDDLHPLLPLGRLLAAAVNPLADDLRAPASVGTATTREALGAPLPVTTMLVLAGVGEVDPARAARLAAFLREGGRALWFLHGPGDAAALAPLAGASSGDFEPPYRVTGWLSTPADATNRPDCFASANFDHPALRRFRDVTALTEIRCRRRAATERVEGAGRVLMRYRDGHVALSAHTVGGGQLLLANFSPAPDASDLARSPLFIPLLQEALRSLRPASPDPGGCAVGAPCSTIVRGVKPEETLSCLDPSGHRVQASYALRGDEALVALPAARQPGLQRIETGGLLRGCAAVNVDRRESEAEVLSATQLRELAARGRHAAAVAQAGDLRAVDELREGRALWPWALLLALGILATEQALVHRWKR